MTQTPTPTRERLRGKIRTLIIGDSLWRRTRRYASTQQISASAIVRLALEEYLRDREPEDG
jgi:hypothetical protein